MDSLLANYASDDDEREESLHEDQNPNTMTLPPPKSNPIGPKSLFSSLPTPKSVPKTPSVDPIPPKSNHGDRPYPQTSLFSSIPAPKSIQPAFPNQNPRKIVQFTLPIVTAWLKSKDLEEDDEEEGKERKPVKDSSSNSSKGLISMLPAPKNSLCLAPIPSAASRRSVLEADDASAMNHEDLGPPAKEASGFHSCGDEVGATSEYTSSGHEASSWVSSYGSGEEYGGYGGSWSDGNVDGLGSYSGSWYDGSVAMPTASPEIPVVEIPVVERIGGKRGRNDIPAEIVEVKQDELMKNRPREDQAKMTGIAFGPSCQPVSSSKGKPSKLHKRKHQIGSLFYDMKQKEMELAERRSRGLLTKAETQAKYGW